MPKFELYTNGEDNEITLKPAEGDVRITPMGALEKRDAYNSWLYICDITQLDNNVLTHDTKLTTLENWKFEQELQTQDSVKAVELEGQWAELKEAGDHLRALEEQCKQAREYMRRLEETLKQARLSYNGVTKHVLEKQKTFDVLDQDYPEGETI